ncbi:MAG: hypothetical protein IPJ65_33015 [Archangiaceae bacterium]|nr:hypothetical protein [Archangiaceae bacterium]
MSSRFSAVLLLALGACSPKVVDLAVNVVSVSCEDDGDPFKDVNVIEVRVTGKGLEPKIVRTPRGEGTVQIPEIPAGLQRVIEVRGLAESSSPRPLSIGRSLPFDIPDVLTDSNVRKELNIFLRRIDTFTRPNSVSNSQDCSRMRTARAGHTATLLPDGRVFIAGGFRLSGTSRTELTDTEFFNPATGSFDDGPQLSLLSGAPLGRAFHTATLLPIGQVLLYGGETYKNNAPSAVASVLVFDLDTQRYGLVPQRTTPTPIARTRHLALLSNSGKVLIAGGLHANPMPVQPALVPVNEVEWYDPATATISVMPGETLPRAGAFGAVVQDGGILIVAGGVDQTNQLSDAVNFYKWDDTSFVRAGATQQLRHARRGAAAMTLADDKTVLVMGGYRDSSASVTEASSEAIKTGANTIEEATATIGDRGDACAALLAEGNVLAIGGKNASAMADNSATLIRFDQTKGTLTSAAAAPLKVPRYLHTCTTLADGSVLVTGGMSDDATVLQDAWIYTPIPGE